MSPTESLRVALRALAANRLRSALTMLGVVIGVMSVVLLVAVGTGAREEVTRGVEQLGSNLLFVVPGQLEVAAAPSASRFTTTDVERLDSQLGGLGQATGTLTSGERVRAEGAASFASVFGVDARYAAVLDRGLDRGVFLSDSDVLTGRRVTVLGSSTAEELFGTADPIGKTVAVAGLRYRVVGVFEPLGGSFGVDRDRQLVIPITAAQRLLGTRRVDTIVVKAPDSGDVADLAVRVEEILGERIDPETFSVLTQDQILGVVGELLTQLTAVLAAIAGVSLLVGGIGVSNIMLVSVSERTPEIGLRKALGARTRDLTVQFLLEAVLLCGLGGVVGIAAGLGLSRLAAALTPVPAVVTWWSVALAFGTSLLVGIAFGVLPARRAGRLDPVVALRRE